MMPLVKAGRIPLNVGVNADADHFPPLTAAIVKVTAVVLTAAVTRKQPLRQLSFGVAVEQQRPRLGNNLLEQIQPGVTFIM
jgi:hypothetical protein